jgi:ABC-type uncharacterized transport system permease subunit
LGIFHFFVTLPVAIFFVIFLVIPTLVLVCEKMTTEVKP